VDAQPASGVRWVLGHFEEVMCAALFGLMSVIALTNIAARYLLKYSFAFTEELVVSLFVWVTLFGAGIAFRDGSHLGFGLLVGRLPALWRRAQCWLAAGLGVILFGAVLYFGFRQVQYEIGFDVRSMGIGVPVWWYTVGMPVWSVLVIVRIVQGAARAARRVEGP
jgi:TRAP-type C4-dicarboxylate transport system permease small subunit